MTELSVLTYNVWFDYRNKDTRTVEIVQLIQSVSPTIVCLQEVTYDMYTYFETKLGTLGYQSCFKNLKQFQKIANNGYGIVIFSKTPIESAGITPFINTKMGRYFAVVKLKEFGGLRIISTHLESLPQYMESRQHQIHQILENTQLMQDVIWTMDSNLTDSGTDCFPVGTNLTDCWITAGSPNEARYTYDAKTNDNILNKFQSRLDRIYYKFKSNWVQTSFQLVGNYNIPTTKAPPSDHYGVLVKFQKIPEA
jgi:endonuclease/exonuclease/phosphatase family metal-dependent hydrolase